MGDIRLFVEDDLAASERVALSSAQAHYLNHVMRLDAGDPVALFNGRDGEWRARLTDHRRGRCDAEPVERTRAQTASPDLWLVFAPVKRARIDFIAAKATELGVSAIRPVITEHTQVTRVNAERLRANAIEAAEQCGRLDVPKVAAPETLKSAMADWPTGRRLLLCDESGEAAPISEVLSGAEDGPWAVLTGPEGGFARSELDDLAILPFVYPAAMGPRILRAETAALAALTCWQAFLGDWRAN